MRRGLCLHFTLQRGQACNNRISPKAACKRRRAPHPCALRKGGVLGIHLRHDRNPELCGSAFDWNGLFRFLQALDVAADGILGHVSRVLRVLAFRQESMKGGDRHRVAAVSKQAGGYTIEAVDGPIGQIRDFVFDDETWQIRYLTIDTREWWQGKSEVLLSTESIDSIDSAASTISTTLSREAIQHSPVYLDDVPLRRMYETQLHKA